MGESLHVCGICGGLFSDYWDHTFCEGCMASICDVCIDVHELFEPSDWAESTDEEWLLYDCPACDPFRHMNDNYEP